MRSDIRKAIGILRKSERTIAFTGAGISVESGIPPFRGENGLWGRYDPRLLELDYFLENGEECWPVIREIFYQYFGRAQPNSAHRVLARMEREGMLGCVVTQNIDNLHQLAGSRVVHEFHGNSGRLVCRRCDSRYPAAEVDLTNLPPRCPRDQTILKPDFVFFGEAIPAKVAEKAFAAASSCRVCLVVGSTGEVAPASFIPAAAKENQATVIEVNPEESQFTRSVTDLFLKGKAGEVFREIEAGLFPE